MGILEACMVLFAFVPILYTLSENITSIPIFGEVEHSLVWVAIVTALAARSAGAYRQSLAWYRV